MNRYDFHGEAIRPGHYICLDRSRDTDNFLLRVCEAAGQLWAETNGNGYFYRITDRIDTFEWLRVTKTWDE